MAIVQHPRRASMEAALVAEVELVEVRWVGVVVEVWPVVLVESLGVGG